MSFMSSVFGGQTAEKRLCMSEIQHQDAERADEENPEWTEEDFRRARPARDVLPDIVGKQTADAILRRGLMPQGTHKASVTMQLDTEVIKYFKVSGQDWQNRINEALREW